MSTWIKPYLKLRHILDFSNKFPYQCHTVWAGVSANCVGRFVIRGVRQGGGCGDPCPLSSIAGWEQQ